MATKVTEPEETISESYISIGLGLLVVVVVGILLYNYFTQKKTQPEPTPEEETLEQEATQAAQPGEKYTVKEGDTLWSISESAYGTGFNWQDIQKANNLPENVSLEPGQELVIPEVTPMLAVKPEISPEPTSEAEEPTIIASPQPQTETITGNTYTVVKGDTLWDIACRAYGDCFAWSKISQANKLVNPDLIHPGNVFTLPR